MPLDARFNEAVAPLFVTGMGTEHVGPLLYSLVRMTRPRRVMEVGLGYTSPFLAQALADNAAEDAGDRACLEKAPEDDLRRSLLREPFFETPYRPSLHAIDDYSGEGTSAPRVLETLDRLGIHDFVKVHKSDFRGYSARIDRGFETIGFEKDGAQIDMRGQHVRREGDGLAIGGGRIVQAALGLQHRAGVVVQIRIFGREGEGALHGVAGGFGPAELLPHQGQIGMGAGIVRGDPGGLLIGFGGFFGPAQSMKGVAEDEQDGGIARRAIEGSAQCADRRFGQDGGVARAGIDRAADQAHGLLRPPNLQMQHAEKVQGRRIARFGLQQPGIGLGGFGRVAGLVMGGCQVQQLGSVQRPVVWRHGVAPRRRFQPHHIAGSGKAERHPRAFAVAIAGQLA